MATFATRTTIAGANSIFVGRRNIYGIMTGWAGVDAAQPGVASGIKRIYGIETVPSPIVSPNRVRRTYDDGPGRIFQFAGVQIPQGDVSFGITDIDLENLAQGSIPWIRGQWKKTIRGLSHVIFQSLVMLVHSVSVSEDPATSGAPGFWNTLFSDTQLLPLGSPQHQAQQTAEVRYSAVFNPAVQYIDGRPFASDNFGATNGTSVAWWSTYPTLFHTKIGNAAWTTIVLDYTPVDIASTMVSIATVTGGVVTVVDAVVTNVNASTKTITLSAPPPAGSYVLVEYEALRLVA